MNNDVKLNDISENLLILNKETIDLLFKLDNCSDCVALYTFYYKTAKWQKTNIIKATDKYARACLKWSVNRLMKTKAALKESELINIIQRRENGKIQGWYIEVNYLVNRQKHDQVNTQIKDNQNLNLPELENSTTCNQETNALKEYIKCLKIEIEMLKKKLEKKDENKKDSLEELIENYSDDETIRDLLKEWLKVRKTKRAASTVRAIELNLAKLKELADKSNMSIKQYLEEVIARGWIAFYEIRNNSGGNRYMTQQEKNAEFFRKMREEFKNEQDTSERDT